MVAGVRYDAMILVDAIDGKRGIISIEIKYTGLLWKNTASKTERKNDDFIRLSVGIEGCDDLICELDSILSNL